MTFIPRQSMPPSVGQEKPDAPTLVVEWKRSNHVTPEMIEAFTQASRRIWRSTEEQRMAPEDNPADDVQPTREEWNEYERSAKAKRDAQLAAMFADEPDSYVQGDTAWMSDVGSLPISNDGILQKQELVLGEPVTFADLYKKMTDRGYRYDPLMQTLLPVGREAPQDPLKNRETMKIDPVIKTVFGDVPMEDVVFKYPDTLETFVPGIVAWASGKRYFFEMHPDRWAATFGIGSSVLSEHLPGNPVAAQISQDPSLVWNYFEAATDEQVEEWKRNYDKELARKVKEAWEKSTINFPRKLKTLLVAHGRSVQEHKDAMDLAKVLADRGFEAIVHPNDLSVSSPERPLKQLHVIEYEDGDSAACAFAITARDDLIRRGFEAIVVPSCVRVKLPNAFAI